MSFYQGGYARAPAPAYTTSYAPAGSYRAPVGFAPAGSYYAPAAPVGSYYAPAPGVLHQQTYSQQVPHTTYGSASFATPVTHATTSMQTVGYAPVVHSESYKQGLGKAPGQVHRAPWHKNKNVEVTQTHIDEKAVKAPVTSFYTDTHVTTVPTQSTHYDNVRTTTTDWHPARY